MKTLQIISRHTSIADAVVAAKLDLSYNPTAAQEKIQMLDNGTRSRGIPPVKEVYLTNEGIFYVYVCDMILLNQFSPFHSIMSDSRFGWARISEDNENEIRITDGLLGDRDSVIRIQKEVNLALTNKNKFWAHKE